MTWLKGNWKKAVSKIALFLYSLLVMAIVISVSAILIWAFQDNEKSYLAAFILIASPIAVWLGTKKFKKGAGR